MVTSKDARSDACVAVAAHLVRAGRARRSRRTIVREEPLDVRVEGRTAGLLLRLPGDEVALAAGFLFTEGLIDRRADVATIGYCGALDGNRVDVSRAGAARRRPPRRRTTAARSSCGLCGRDLVEDLDALLQPVPPSAVVPPATLARLASELRSLQRVFPATGGTHAALLADEAGAVLAFAEDVGRHNALDKAIGRLLLGPGLERARVAMVSSRVSYEMAQKAVRAGCAVLAGVSAPTSLALDVARRFGLALVGFLRGEEMTVYAGAARLGLTRGARRGGRASRAGSSG